MQIKIKTKSDLCQIFIYNLNMNKYEYEANQIGYQYIIGVDEVGRGCIAGPLVCAGVIFPIGYTNSEIKDSKMLSIKQREKLYDQIIQDCLAYHIVIISPEEVDHINPKQASRLGMKRCVQEIEFKPDYALIDFEKLDIDIPSLSLVKGDQKSVSIAAASIIAKVYRDRILDELHTKYPQYDFLHNKGYLTKKHIQALKDFGPIKSIHRFSYKPISNK